MAKDILEAAREEAVRAELQIATDFLNEVADHGPAGDDDGFIDRNDVLEMCRDAIRRLALEDVYESFRSAVSGNAVYALSDEGEGVVEVVTLEE
jgi:hypothetical protein